MNQDNMPLQSLLIIPQTEGTVRHRVDLHYITFPLDAAVSHAYQVSENRNTTDRQAFSDLNLRCENYIKYKILLV